MMLSNDFYAKQSLVAPRSMKAIISLMYPYYKKEAGSFIFWWS